jgi:hypothetical protein
MGLEIEVPCMRRLEDSGIGASFCILHMAASINKLENQNCIWYYVPYLADLGIIFFKGRSVILLLEL